MPGHPFYVACPPAKSGYCGHQHRREHAAINCAKAIAQRAREPVMVAEINARGESISEKTVATVEPD